jgi:hypothetical protein
LQVVEQEFVFFQLLPVSLLRGGRAHG